MKKRIAIIGAGTCGLVAIKSCLEEGLEPVCFEKTQDIGGLWCFREDCNEDDAFKTTTVFRSTCTNTSKEIMAFSDFPMPKEFPNYLHNSDMIRYLHLYADKFDLKRHVVCGTIVKHVRPAADYDATGCWTVELENKDGRQWNEIFDAVLICNGHHGKPNRPNVPEIEDFKGDIIHTQDYKRPGAYEDKRVLVIGMGNSACDASVEIARIASKVFQSTRSGHWIMGRLTDRGLPLDTMIRRIIFLIPRSIVVWNVARRLNAKFDHTIHGLKPTNNIFAKAFTINDELPYQIVNGNIVIKPGISRFHKGGVEFEDGTYEDIDCVILGTGYFIDMPVDSSVIDVNFNHVHLYRSMFPSHLEHPTLAVIGLTQPVGPANPLCEIQSRWVARLIKGLCKLPTKDAMELYIKRYKEYVRKTTVDTDNKGKLTVDAVTLIDEIADDIGVSPQLGRMLFRDPILAMRCFFGPWLPYQYRLRGPGKWDGAKEAIETSWDRVIGAYCQSRKGPQVEKSTSAVVLKTFAVAAVLAAAIYSFFFCYI